MDTPPLLFEVAQVESMFTVNGTDYTIIVVGLVGALLFFTIQLILCCKSKRLAIKLIPIYIFLLCVLIMAADFAGMVKYSGFFSGRGILGTIIAIVAGISLIGDVAAWAVYRTRKKK